MLHRLGGHAEVGDRVPVGSVELIVRDTDETGHAVTAAGLALTPEPHPSVPAWPIVRSITDLAAIVRTRWERLRRRLGRTRS
jgi:cell volume regulation protein A